MNKSNWKAATMISLSVLAVSPVFAKPSGGSGGQSVGQLHDSATPQSTTPIVAPIAPPPPEVDLTAAFLAAISQLNTSAADHDSIARAACEVRNHKDQQIALKPSNLPRRVGVAVVAPK